MFPDMRSATVAAVAADSEEVHSCMPECFNESGTERFIDSLVSVDESAA